MLLSRAVSDRVFCKRIKQFNIAIIQIYAPTQHHGYKQSFFDEFEKAIHIVKSDEMLMVMGDWNAEVRSDAVPGVIGRFRLCDQNDGSVCNN